MKSKSVTLYFLSHQDSNKKVYINFYTDRIDTFEFNGIQSRSIYLPFSLICNSKEGDESKTWKVIKKQLIDNPPLGLRAEKKSNQLQLIT